MRDLKHQVLFENLLEEVKNELVDKALADGKLALGYSCYYVPEVLMNLDNKIMFLLYKIFNKITDKVPRDRRF